MMIFLEEAHLLSAFIEAKYVSYSRRTSFSGVDRYINRV